MSRPTVDDLKRELEGDESYSLQRHLERRGEVEPEASGLPGMYRVRVGCTLSMETYVEFEREVSARTGDEAAELVAQEIGVWDAEEEADRQGKILDPELLAVDALSVTEITRPRQRDQ